MQDLRHAFRMLIKNPGFTIMSVLMLALGIGACTAIFTVVNSVLLRPLPYPRPDRLVQLFEVSDQGNRMNVPEANFVDWKAGARSFQSMAMFSSGLTPVLGGVEPVRVRVATVSSDFFNVLGVKPVIGTTPLDSGTEPTAVVGYGFWQRVLGGSTNLQTRKLTSGGITFSVVGVMPPGFSFPPGTEVWGPRSATTAPFNPSRSAHNWSVIARMKPESRIEEAHSEMSNIVKRLREENKGKDFTAVDGAAIPLQEQLTQNVRVALPVLFGAVVILLFIACANVSNLLLAHGAGRQRELAIRSALGAKRAALIRLFLTQSLVMTAVGAVAGVLIALFGVDALLSISAGNLPRLDEIQVDARVLGFSIAISIIAGALLGIVPAYRIGNANLDEVMKEGGRSQSQGRSHRRVRSALIVSQVALTLMLLVGAGLLGRSFVRLLQVELGFQTANRMTVDLQLSPPAGQNFTESRSRFAAFYQELMTRIAAIPGVRNIGGASQIPLSGRNSNGRFLIEGGRNSEQYWPGHRIASAGYFETMGIPLLRGRLFNETDGTNSPEVAVISKTVADTVWPGQDAIGRRINTANMDGDPQFMTIVGIVGDVRQTSPEVPARGEIYVHYLQRGFIGTFTLVLDSTVPAEGLVPAINSYVRQLNPDATVRFQTLEQSFSSVLANRRFNLLLLGVFGGTALLLALLGVYGVTAYSVAQRTQEIGIRMALGAQSADVVRLFVSDGTRLVVIGIVLGLIGAVGGGRVMSSLLYEVRPVDIVTYIVAAVPLFFASLVASHVPARRASRVDPLITIQSRR